VLKNSCFETRASECRQVGQIKLNLKLSFNQTAGLTSNALTKVIKISLPFATAYMCLTSDGEDEGPTTTKKGKLLSIANIMMSRT